MYSSNSSSLTVAESGSHQVQKRLTLTFRRINVRVTAPDAALGDTLLSVADPRQFIKGFYKSQQPKRTILKDVSGQVRPGEMLLVLGRPGSGCTSLLRVLSNDRDSFDEIDGETRYGSMDHREAKRYRQQIMFNNEDDVHFPTLTVNHTLKFALRTKVPRERPEYAEKKEYVQDKRDSILNALGIPHTKKTKVGNEFIRGVSGGERKRVSLAEVMAGQSPIQFWDNPTRGLDSRTAVEFSQLLRQEANDFGKTIVTTTYQAGNDIYDQFDKVLVLAEGRVIYYGPRSLGRSYFENMGFVCPKGANIADFLTSVTVHTERVICDEMRGRVPSTPDEFEAAYHASKIYTDMMENIESPEKLQNEKDDLIIAVNNEKKKNHILRTHSPYTTKLTDQIISCSIRQFQIMMGDKLSLSIKVGSAIIQALLDAGKFFTFWIIVNVNTLCSMQMFRAIGALSRKFGNASKITGLLSTVFFVYGGYLIPFERMHVWFRWIFYLNPGAYAFEALMANEFRGLELECVAPDYLPYGSGYSDTISPNRGCSVVGSSNGIIDGEAYIGRQFHYSYHHIWRSFGVIVAMWFFFIFLTSLGFELRNSQSGSSVLLYKRGSEKKQHSDEEKGISSSMGTDLALNGSVKQSTFTWNHLDYHVPFQGDKKQLLHQVFGYVKPGNLVALMGSSGAGKTTYDSFAQRKDSGEIYGSILIDGKPQGISFQRTTGYCEQMDVHEGTATVREALEFSALLRQPSHVPRKEKIEYVDQIIELLELSDIQDALIGVPGAGLSIEQRKRVTLGVELVAKPTLLFLDEPTSGLDGQSAYNIIRFLRKLVDGGQAVLCTIHQPSAVLFDAFDSLLLLAKGGRMAYFGQMLDYFSKNGAPCPPDTNPAEHIVEVIQGKSQQRDVDWVDVWNKSEERQIAIEQLETLNRVNSAKLQTEEDESDYATSRWFQFCMVTKRLMVQLWRSPDYMWNKIILHIFAALFSGFTFWNMGNSSFDLQLRLFAIFNFIFVAPGCINQMQPFFLHNRDIFETREKKSKTYHWIAFIGAQVVSEIPYLILCATLYFLCWYYTAGFPNVSSIAGHVYLQMIFYEFLYTSLGQGIAAYAPNEYFAAILNPVILGAGMVSFCGVVVPYSQMQPFWRYWLYYLDPFKYLVGGLLGEVLWDVKVECTASELVHFAAPANQTCGVYMADFLSSAAGYIVDANSTDICSFCQFSTGADYAKTFNLGEKYYAWRDTGITALFCISCYATVFLMMKLRSKKTKSARSE
uniref:Brefeldin A resistance protein n=1 Tax=Talaromyces marneffei PM1 TaxID=1077442 RepID=A0A093X940_TALMA